MDAFLQHLHNLSKILNTFAEKGQEVYSWKISFMRKMHMLKQHIENKSGYEHLHPFNGER